MMRLAHISDLHFSKFSFNPLQFFSKRWLGNLNLLFVRNKQHINERPFSLIQKFKEEGVTHVMITGDLTTTSFTKEFQLALTFVRALQEEGIQVVAIPGNHDHYTKWAYRKRYFYRYFPERYAHQQDPLHHFSLKQEGIAAMHLDANWVLIALDTTLATPIYSSAGKFSPHIRKNLENVFSLIQKDQQIILVNHFPFFDLDGKRRKLIHGEDLEALIQQHPNIAIYMHGHTHRHCIADLRNIGLPILLDSGSCSYYQGATWNLLDLKSDALEIHSYKYVENKWEKQTSNTYELR